MPRGVWSPTPSYSHRTRRTSTASAPIALDGDISRSPPRTRTPTPARMRGSSTCSSATAAAMERGRGGHGTRSDWELRFAQCPRAQRNDTCGRPYLDDDLGPGAGAAYVFERNAGGPGHWGLVDKLRAPDGERLDRFGYDVVVSGRRIAVGARGDDHIAEDAGSVYVFDWAAPVLSVTGSCPGPMELSFTGATRKGVVALAAAQAEGSFTIPGAPCPGLVLGLEQPRLLSNGCGAGQRLAHLHPRNPACGLWHFHPGRRHRDLLYEQRAGAARGLSREARS